MAGKQSSNNDSQSFDVDIDAVYKNFIIEIDNLRSKEDQNLTESRCNAFYRLIGLPVCDKVSLYSPGFDSRNNNNTDLNKTKSIIQANIKKDTAMLTLLDARENQPRNHLSIFSVQDVNATLLALSSVDIRDFSAPFKRDNGAGDIDPFDTDLTAQQYIVNIITRLVPNVQDSSGNIATNYASVRPHFLKPLLVNPFIDSNVKPGRNRLVVPFVKDKSDTKLNNNDYLKRPYIEKVCRDRFSSADKINTLGTNTLDIIESIKSNPAITDETLIRFLNPNNITSEQVQAANYINIIRSMLMKLSESVDNVLRVVATDPNNKGQAKYNWYPVPNKSGPEIGCVTRELTEQQNDPFNTQQESEIIELQFNERLKSINNKLLQVQKVDLGGFAFDNNEITPDSNSSDAYGNTLVNPIENAISARKTITEDANVGLKHIEIIMGEFSGLGLCDILAICTALWVVDKDVLLNLLDDTALARMAEDPSLKVTAITRDTPGSIAKFERTVKEVYELMDKLYRDIRSGNTR